MRRRLLLYVISVGAIVLGGAFVPSVDCPACQSRAITAGRLKGAIICCFGCEVCGNLEKVSIMKRWRFSRHLAER